MVDILSFAISISSLAFVYFASIIRRRLCEIDGGSGVSLFILNQPRQFRRYLTLARDHRWSRIPVFGACIALLSVLTFSAGIITILISHRG